MSWPSPCPQDGSINTHHPTDWLKSLQRYEYFWNCNLFYIKITLSQALWIHVLRFWPPLITQKHKKQSKWRQFVFVVLEVSWIIHYSHNNRIPFLYNFYSLATPMFMNESIRIWYNFGILCGNVKNYLVFQNIIRTFALEEKRSLEAKQSEKE